MWDLHRLRLLFLITATLISGCAPWYALPGPAVQTPILEARRIIAADGAVLPLRRWLPTGETAGVIIALHGFNDYSNAFSEPTKIFAKSGLITYAYDQRGFGNTANRGFWAGKKGFINDLRMVIQLVRGEHPDKPLFILGESFGAAVILASTNHKPSLEVEGYILVSPAVWGRQTMPWWQLIALEFFAHTMPLFHVTGQGLGRVPSDNVEMLRKIGSDPLVIKHTRLDTLYGFVGLMDAALKAAPFLRGDGLVLWGEKEDILPDKAMSAFNAKLPENGCARLARYESGHHMLLRDLKADIVLADIIHWISRPRSKLPSGADAVAIKNSETEGYGARPPVALDCN